eukprot:CAMPEP_0185033384 /NCGR_PEP_ID=MMETSP1103-20130426/22251_1 /TAXON_ID=36769 /ORGANISM="Paraphysomonas bandaiensis, Strain Caron Lab Isolate" /LENGTH=635 /DNA_ID=CAMNT_0027569627 /DNA_START=40 /DNA_END=1944 /DNA_ORIENTATION=+
MEFWRPSTAVDRGDIHEPPPLHPGRHKHLPISYQRQLLPIHRHKRELLYCLEKYKVLVLVGETGSGKSTQIPQFLYEAGWAAGGRCIVCTQPRRVATISVASRTAEEFGCLVGEDVGYAIRFDSKCGPKTSIKYCTDGLLLRETLTDPLLSKYSVVMVDEAHERSLYTDILLGLLKKIKRKRPELRVIVTSATLNAVEIKNFFETGGGKDREETACILSVAGRTHDVDILYLEEPTSNYVRCAVQTVLDIHAQESDGDVLVFLPGAEEIDSAIQMLEDRYEKPDLIALPLYSTLPHRLQMRAFDPTPPKHRKVVFATNIAETSVTIEGIKYIVDSGFVKMKYFDPESGVDSLVTCSISKASACQRTGRAGRTQPGKCFRLMPESAYQSLPLSSPPEMQRVDISWAVLQLKALGIDDVLHFDFLSPPPVKLMIFALELLFSLGALDESCCITASGSQMADMPVEPRLSRALLASLDMGCSEEMLSVAAMCAVEHPFITMRGRASEEAKQRLLDCRAEFVNPLGDHLTLLNIYQSYVSSGCNSSWCDSMCLQARVLSRAHEVRTRLRKMLIAFAPEGCVLASCEEDNETIRRCIVAGYFANVAQLGSGGMYWTVRGRIPVTVHPSSVLARFGAPPEW